jgi:tetratricopeptide (TPR) repeat protein
VTTQRRSILNFVTIAALLTTIGAIASPFLIAAWKQSGLIGGVPPSQAASLKTQVTQAEKLLLEQPDNQVALRAIVNSKLQLADIKGSISPLEKLATLNPQTPAYMVLVAQAQQYLGDREAAVTSYKRILNSAPQNIQALQGLSSVLIDGKKPEAAIGIVQEAIKFPIPTGQNADIGSMKLLLGQIYVSQKRNGDALTIYDELVQSNAQDFRPLLAKAIVLKQMGNLTEAQTLLDRSVEVAPAQYKDQIQTLAKSTVPPALNNPVLNATPSAVPSATISPTTSPAASGQPSPSAPVPAVPQAPVTPVAK